jgi:hypothetical protein
MKISSLIVCTTVVVALIYGRAAFAAAPPDSSSARQLIAKVFEARRTTGFRIRSKLTVTTSNSERREVKQLLIKGRSDGIISETLYQVLWPSELKGQSLLIQKTTGRPVSGFIFEPPAVTKRLTTESMRESFFGSGLAIEDLAEDFWDWPSQKIIGQETIKERLCQIVESRPPGDAATGYSLIRTWIAPELALPLLVEKYGKNRRLIRRISADRIMKSSDRWIAATIIVDLEGHGRTILEGSKTERDLDLPDSDFTLDALKREFQTVPSLPSKPAGH